MTLNEKSLDLIKSFEQLRLKVYPDQAGLPTIGWGHLIKPDENLTEITKEQADDLLKKDLQIAEDAANKYIHVRLSDNQYGAIVSFIFNTGVQAFRGSTLLRKLNQGQFEEVPEHIAEWNKVTKNGVKQISNGLVNRRMAEIKLWNTP